MSNACGEPGCEPGCQRVCRPRGRWIACCLVLLCSFVLATNVEAGKKEYDLLCSDDGPMYQDADGTLKAIADPKDASVAKVVCDIGAQAQAASTAAGALANELNLIDARVSTLEQNSSSSGDTTEHCVGTPYSILEDGRLCNLQEHVENLPGVCGVNGNTSFVLNCWDLRDSPELCNAAYTHKIQFPPAQGAARYAPCIYFEWTPQPGEPPQRECFRSETDCAQPFGTPIQNPGDGIDIPPDCGQCQEADGRDACGNPCGTSLCDIQEPPPPNDQYGNVCVGPDPAPDECIDVDGDGDGDFTSLNQNPCGPDEPGTGFCIGGIDQKTQEPCPPGP